MKLNKIYEPNKFESKISKKWKQKAFFSKHDLAKRPFTIILPPPNVTGKLHIGHALNTALQDTIIRYKKLKGYDVFYVAGMDHAGIATQSKVESNIYKLTGKSRHDFGREEFVNKIWDWKHEYSDSIRKQWETLGLGLDYKRERFTLDKESNNAVNKAFIDFYKRGLIYRGTKAINWDPKLKTALSNIEVLPKATEQNMLYIKYPIANSNEFLTIATVRPETMLSDVAVIYNPNDKRYNKLKNIEIVHPLTKKIIPFIADEYTEIEFGSGLMKLSAHAEVDIDIIKKHNLDVIETINQDGFINAPDSIFHGLDRFEARKKIEQYLIDNNLIVKIEKTTSNVGYSERSGEPVEILVMPQWFVKMEELNKLILEHLKTSDSVKFFPKRFKDTLKTWMENAYDWTISRQLWWGHRIPAWYKGDDIKVQESCPGDDWVQDSDVLDTWFSSGLAPFSFLGWPLKKSEDMLNRYFPTSLLVTGYDIIFFWVARMYFFSLAFKNNKPFEHLLLTGLVRDEQGRKMSKSLGNGIDPMEVVEEYGADALRWFLTTNTTPGLDIRYSTEKIKSAWGLCNKIWNIARYIQNLPEDNNKKPSQADRWINNKLVKLNKTIDKAFEKYELTIIGYELNKFIYSDFSSWYVEMLKIMPNKKAALANFKKLLIILHPLLPFITDYLYKTLYNEEILESEPLSLKHSKSNMVNEVDLIIKTVSILRKYREDNGISKKEAIKYDINFVKNSFIIDSIYKLANATIKENKDTVFVDGDLIVNIEESEERKQIYISELKQRILVLESEIKRASQMLNNDNFVAKAPANKIQEERDKLAKFNKEIEKYREELKWKS
ncbi:valine--tRNA ligase [Mycoplasma sp. ES3225-GEN-MYC]|uniref:Valine--tRNA ligase n=1 Tax=Mycoplasma miroungigenitalium TaxID=754515 RepID=A0A6M4J8C9_9MOLU|nr:valine--tRNA ligase [Mycoplasma miroungigenitalium]MBU4691399.1 valine--tRNA ligase [Mycoplasma miroungigenitalium]QJR43234.1 valine--tRNA ligase [Mycoplasma miroungigenitalium]